MSPEKCFAAMAAVFFVSTIVALVQNAIKSKEVVKWRYRADELDCANKELIEQNLVLEAQREVFCMGEVTVTLDAKQVDPKQVEFVASLIRWNLKKADKKRRQF